MMAAVAEKPIFTVVQTEEDQEEDMEEAFAASSGFCVCCFKPWGGSSGRADRWSLLHGKQKETWGARKLKKLKEVSEVVAGPKWKTFLHRFGCGNNGGRRKAQFQYDPQSYALNFDCGANQERDGECPLFSTRFAASSAKNTAY